MSDPFYILTNQTTNATSSFVTIVGSGLHLAEFEGTTGSASVALVAKGAQKRTSVPITDVLGATLTFTVPVQKPIYLCHGEEVAAVVTSASGTTNISLTLRKVREN